jgi:hypothetical protein
LNKSNQTFGFEKYFVSPEYIPLSKNYSDSSDNKTTKDSSVTEYSKEYFPTLDISNERRASFFEIYFSTIMVIRIINPLNIRIQSGPNNFSKMFILMKLTKQELRDLQEQKQILLMLPLNLLLLLKQLDINNGRKQ